MIDFLKILWNTLAIRTLFIFLDMEQDWLISRKGQKILKENYEYRRIK